MNAEASLDARFASLPLPTNDLETTFYILLTVSEDVLRFAVMNKASAWTQDNTRNERASLVSVFDDMKYSLKNVLDLARRRLTRIDLPSPRIPTSSDNYAPTVDLLNNGVGYADATRAFSSFHAGGTEFLIDRSSGVITISPDDRTSQYNSLELLLNSERPTFSPLVVMATIFNGPSFPLPSGERGEWSDTLHKIVQRTRVRRNSLRYQRITAYARDLYDTFNAPSDIVESDWLFPWGSLPDCQRYFAALQAIAAYNLIAVHFGSGRHSLQGMGVDQLCIVEPAHKIALEISNISGLNIDTTRTITSALTYGAATNTPDPALQPLIPLSGDNIAIPGFLVLSSNWSRNMLSLHTRIEERSFNSASKSFETRMLKRAMEGLPNRLIAYPNRNVPTKTGFEEIDLVLVDVRAKLILLVEMRWFLQPGDVREVLNRKKALREKVVQAQRKARRVRENVNQVISSLQLERGPWKVETLISFEGFGGTPSQEPKECPAVPIDIFLKIVSGFQDLEHAHAFMTTPIWLPQLGSDIFRRKDTVDTWGILFDRPGIEVGSESYMLGSLPRYINRGTKMSLESLKSAAW